MRDTLRQLEEAQRGDRDVMQFAKLRRWVDALAADAKPLKAHLGFGHGYVGKPGQAYDRLMQAGDAVDTAVQELLAAMQALEDALE